MSAELATFLFHDVTNDVTDSGFQRDSALAYKHPTRLFAEYLECIAAAGRSPERVTDLVLPGIGRHLLLTFDDGGRSALHVSDELLRRGWRAHFFIITGRIGHRTFLDAAGVRTLQAAGHVVGSHSHTHPNIFRDLTPAQMDEEWRVSCDRLAQLLGEPCRVASVPCGDLSATVMRSADRAGLGWLFTSDPTRTPRRVGNCWIVGRACPKRDTPSSEVRRLAEFRGWRRALALRRTNVLARMLLAPAYRRWVRAHEAERA
jgi:peptidoglycan/xylan/chitin deacetylase (PgdA/CDA1 family)